MSLLCRHALLLTFSLLLTPLASAEDYTLESTDTFPAGVPADVAKVLAVKGHRVTGPDGPLCSVWLAKSLSVKEKFSPTLSVKSPLVPGSFVGLLQVGDGTEFTDFREQVLLPGLYTLRYGQQPEDGNHIGTSDVADFLLALPAAEDASPKPIGDTDELTEISAVASGSTHPAILSLRPAGDAKPGNAMLIHDSDDDLWILQTSSGGDQPVVLQLVVVGFALE